MTTRKTRGAPALLLAAFVLSLQLIAVPAARAADPDAPSDTADGWRNVVRYAHCAFLVFTAVSPVEWTMAFADCTRLYMAQASLTSGAAS